MDEKLHRYVECYQQAEDELIKAKKDLTDKDKKAQEAASTTHHAREWLKRCEVNFAKIEANLASYRRGT